MYRYLFFLTLSVFSAVSVALPGEAVDVLRGSDPSGAAPHGEGNVYAPDIVSHGGRFCMYYGGQGSDGHDRIHLAVSQDRRSWQMQGVVFAPEGVNHVNDPSVVILDGSFYMYYTRADTGVADCIGLATSSDGRVWLDQGAVFVPSDQPAWDSLLVGRPSVVHDGKIFRLWYDGRADLPIGAPDPTPRKSAFSQRFVGYAESKDGVSWNRHGDYIYAKDAGGIHVSWVEDRYVMLVESRDGTKWAESHDGLSWSDRGLLVVKDQNTSPHGHVTPFLFADSNSKELYFGAAHAENWDRNSIMRVGILWPTDSSGN
jgi:hypothetical protein